MTVAVGVLSLIQSALSPQHEEAQQYIRRHEGRSLRLASTMAMANRVLQQLDQAEERLS